MALTLSVVALVLLVLACLLAVGHQHNTIAALTRRMDAAAVVIEALPRATPRPPARGARTRVPRAH